MANNPKWHTCVAEGCSNNTSMKEFSFHSIPKDTRRNAWLSIIGKREGEIRKRSVLCSAHFTEDQFQRDLRVSV